jgi:hypothetical protein
MSKIVQLVKKLTLGISYVVSIFLDNSSAFHFKEATTLLLQSLAALLTQQEKKKPQYI